MYSCCLFCYQSAVQVLDLLKDLLPPVASINQQFAPPTPPVNQSTDSCNGQSAADIHTITTSMHYAVVECDHPYKPATVANYKVTTLLLFLAYAKNKNF